MLSDLLLAGEVGDRLGCCDLGLRVRNPSPYPNSQACEECKRVYFMRELERLHEGDPLIAMYETSAPSELPEFIKARKEWKEIEGEGERREREREED